MPILYGIRKILLKIKLLIISVVLMKGQSKFVTSYMGPWWGWGAERGPGTSPAQFPQISVLQSSPKSTVTQLAVHDYGFLHQDHSAYSNDLTPSDYYLFWNLIMMVSTIH